MKNENGIEKSAILKGKSEVAGKNKCNMKEIKTGWLDGTTGKVSGNEGVHIPVEVSGTITISNYIHTNIRYVYEYDANGKYLGRTKVTTDTVTLVLTQNTTLIKIAFYGGTLSTVKSLELQVEQGEIATEYEPYNPTLVSVKMPVLTTTGKNLFDGDFYFRQKYGINIKTIVDADNRTSVSTVINVRPNTEYYIKSFNQLNGKLRFKGVMFYDANGDYLSETFGYMYAGNFVTPSNCHYITFEVQTTDWSEYTLNELKSQNYQIEEGSVATSYEPFKSNILTVNEPVELRGIGNVKDELDLLTGELTERISEVVLDGMEEWNVSGHSNWTACYTRKYILPHLINKGTSLVSDKMNSYIHYDYLCNNDVIGISITKEGYICFKYLPNGSKPQPSEVSDYLKSNPITIQYPLETESIKTVDLTITDQDNQPQERMKLFPKGHINTSSSTFPPFLELKGITHNNKLNMTTTNGTNNTQ